MATPTFLDPIYLNPPSDIYEYVADPPENIFRPSIASVMNVNEKAIDNPLKGLVEIARNEKVKCIALMISPTNEFTQQICQYLGFALDRSQEIGMIEALMEL